MLLVQENGSFMDELVECGVGASVERTAWS
jgi:hypothetical protein